MRPFRGVLAALLLCAPSFAAPAAQTKYIGDGALRLIPGALQQARARWGDDICFTGLSMEVARNVKTFGPGSRHGRITTFQFEFLSRQTASRYHVFFTEADGPAPYDPAGATCPLDSYREFGQGTSKTGCVAGFSIDSDDALGIATRHGLNLARYPSPFLNLHLVDRESSLWTTHKKLRNKTVWLVTEGKDSQYQVSGRFMVIIDASKGLVLDKGENRRLGVGSAGGEEWRYPNVSVSKNLCSEDSL